MALKVWLPLDGDLHNQGCVDITVNNTGATVDNNGKIGKCYSFSSKALYGDIPNLNNYTQISGCCWIYLTNLNSAQYFIHCGGQSSYPCKFSIDYEGSIRFQINGKEYISGITLTTNTWYHIAVTWNSAEAKLYVNGVERSTKNTSGTFNASNHFAIGARTNSTAGNAFAYYITSAGKINDVRIYDHCLSAAEVKEIAQGLVLHYKLDGFFGGAGENLVINGDARNGLTSWSNWGTATNRQVVTIGTKKWLNFKTDPNGNYGGFSQDRGIALYKPNTQYTISALMYASANASGRLWVHTRSTEGGANLSQYLTTVSVTTSPALYTFTFNTGTNASYTINKLNLMVGAVSTTSALDFYISDIKVEEGAKATPWVPCKEEGGYDTTKIEDGSGYNHNGIINSNPTISLETKRYNYSISFDGVDDCIKIPFNDIIKDKNYTVSVWTYKTSIGTKNYQTILGGPSGFELEARSSSSTSPLYRIHNWGGGTTAYEFNKWNLFTFAHTDSDSKLYVNGELKITGTSANIPTGNYYIGAWNSVTGQNYEGLMSDFRIYCTPLLDTDIKQLYNVGMKVDNLGGVHGFELNEETNNIKENEIVLNTTDKTITYDKNTNTYTFSLSSHSSGTHLLWYPTKNRTVANHSVEIPWGCSFVHTFEIFSDKTTNLIIDYNDGSIDSNITLSGNDNDTNRLPASVSLTENTWKTVTFSYSNTNESKNPNHVTLYDYSYIYVAAHDDSYTIEIKSPMTYVVDNDSKMSINKNGIISYNQFLESSTKNYGSISEKTKAVEASTFIEM